jgi:hypothetical protein
MASRIGRWILAIACLLAVAGAYGVPPTALSDLADSAGEQPAGADKFSSAAREGLPVSDLDPGLRAAIDRTLYAVEEASPTVPGEGPVYRARNRQQRLEATFKRGAFRVSGEGPEGSPWTWGLRLVGYGYGDDRQPMVQAELSSTANRIEYRRGPIVEWYVNEPRGIEQGFTITAPSEGVGASGGPLTVEMEVLGDLTPRMRSDGREIAFGTESGVTALRYGELHALDAAGRLLPSEMRLASAVRAEASTGQRIELRVDAAGAVYPITIDPLVVTREQTLTASDGEAGDHFGRSVAVSGNVAVVGAAENGDNSGSAYVFRYDGASWNQEQKLTASDGATDDLFGYSVAVSGNVAVVGAVLDDDNGTDSGSAYVFRYDGASWNQEQKLTALDGWPDHYFGISVAVCGNVAVVGALWDDYNGTDKGSVYVFRYDGLSWTQEQKLTAADGAAFDHFGESVAVSENVVVVGADQDDDNGSDAGSAYVFRYDGASWGQEQKLTALDGAMGDRFGGSVAVSGNVAVVGALRDDDNGANSGSAYVFRYDGASWSQEQKLTASDGASADFFGNSVAVSGNLAVAGAFDDDDNGTGSGSAYVFRYDEVSWNQEQKLTASDGEAGDHFGRSVAVLGGVAVVGASSHDIGSNESQGSAYVFDLSAPVHGLVVVDNFNEPADFTISADDTSVSSNNTHLSTADTLGGVRSWTLKANAVGGTAIYSLPVGGGSTSLTASAGGGWLLFVYGQHPNADPSIPLPFDFTAGGTLHRLEVDVSAVSVAATIEVRVHQFSDGRVFTATVPVLAPGVLSIPYASFSGSPDFTDVKLISLELAVSAAGEIEITEFRAVPSDCSDGLDNDGDGLIDFPEDRGCRHASDLSEEPECADGLDNDGDGRIDFDPVTFANPGDATTLPAGLGDPGCKDLTWGTESPQCQDGLNNDPIQDYPHPGHVDYDGGLSALGYVAADPDPQCVGRPWKNTEAQQSCGLGVELASMLAPLMWLRRRRSRRV